MICIFAAEPDCSRHQQSVATGRAGHTTLGLADITALEATGNISENILDQNIALDIFSLDLRVVTVSVGWCRLWQAVCSRVGGSSSLPACQAGWVSVASPPSSMNLERSDNSSVAQ